NIDAIASQNNGQRKHEFYRRILPGNHVKRLQRNLAFVVLLQSTVKKLRAQILSVRLDRLFLGVERNLAVGQLETPHGQIDDGLERGRVRPRRSFRSRNVGPPIREDEDVHLRLVQAQIRQIHQMAQAGE